MFAYSDLEAVKRRELKRIAKEINRKKFKWYKPATGEALPQMGRFFFDIYAVVGPAQAMLSKANTSALLKLIVIEESLSEKQRKIKEGLAEEQLRERARSESAGNLEAQVATELEDFQREFTEEKIQRINHTYSQIEAFADFVMFDYYFMLKKFDSSIPERDFSYVPRCSAIRGEYVLEDLKDFAAASYSLPVNAEWKSIFAMIKNYRGDEPVELGQWTKILRQVDNVRKSNILALIISHIDKNPSGHIKPIAPNTRIVEAYISKFNERTEGFLKKIAQESKVSMATKLLQQLFGFVPPATLRNYTAEASEDFKSKNFAGFTRVAELNYLNAFLSAYLKTAITEITDLCVVRGKWLLHEDSAVFSGNYHALIELSGKIKEFDESLDEMAPLGSKLKTLFLRQEHDREARSQLGTNLKDVNRVAMTLLYAGMQSLLAIGKSLKMLLEDHKKKPSVLITNWDQLENITGKGIEGMLAEVYRKVYAIVMLLQIYLKDSKK